MTFQEPIPGLGVGSFCFYTKEGWYTRKRLIEYMKKDSIQVRRNIFKDSSRQRWGFSKPGFVRSFVYSARIFWEFMTGFRFVANFGKSASFFGSAREALSERYYTDAEELAARLSVQGFAIITGGSGGIMRAANKGAHRVNGESVGINISLPHEQNDNKFLKHSRTFRHFSSRKLMLSCASEVYVFFPGGFGTLDELFEMLTLVQTRVVDPVPIILYGKEYWDPLIDFIREHLRDKHMTISKEDIDLFVVMDSVDEAEHYVESLGISQTHACKFNFLKKEGAGYTL